MDNKQVNFVYIVHEGEAYITFPDGIPAGHAIRVVDIIESMVKINDEVQIALGDIKIDDDE